MAEPACVEYFTLDQTAEFALGTFSHNFSNLHTQDTLWRRFRAMLALLTGAMGVRFNAK
jgi:hypothetical protein